MNELFSLYTPEEINAFIRVITGLLLLVFATSLGTFTRELIFPRQHTFGQNVGLAFVAGFIAFGVTMRYADVLTIEKSFLICIALGFFVPVFKDWLKGKKIFKILFKAMNKTTDIASAVMEEIETELDKE